MSRRVGSTLNLTLLGADGRFELSFTCDDDGTQYVTKLDRETALLLAKNLLRGISILDGRLEARAAREAN